MGTLSARLSLGHERTDTVLHTFTISRLSRGCFPADTWVDTSRKDSFTGTFITAAPNVMSHRLGVCARQKELVCVQLDGMLAQSDITNVLKCVGGMCICGEARLPCGCEWTHGHIYSKADHFSILPSYVVTSRREWSRNGRKERDFGWKVLVNKLLSICFIHTNHRHGPGLTTGRHPNKYTNLVSYLKTVLCKTGHTWGENKTLDFQHKVRCWLFIHFFQAAD